MTAQEQIDKWNREGAYQSQFMYEDNGKIFGKYVGEIKACQFCGEPSSAIDEKCHDCWEIVSRIESKSSIGALHAFKRSIDKRLCELIDEVVKNAS